MNNQRIMIADQDPEIREQVQRSLKNRALTVFGAENAFDAVVKFGTFKPGLILLEDGLPGDALLAMRRIQARAGGDSPTFIMLARKATRELVEQSLQNGIKDIMAKPLTGPDIALRVEKYTSKGVGSSREGLVAAAI